MATNPGTPHERITLFSEDGKEIGTVAAFHVTAHTGVPVFAQLEPDAPGVEGLVVPVLHAVAHASGLAVPYSGARIMSAPQVSGRAVLTDEMLRSVVTYYALEGEVVPSTPPDPTAPPEPIPIPIAPGPDIIPAYVELPMTAEG